MAPVTAKQISGMDTRRRATGVAGSKTNHIRGCHYSNCMVEERAFHGAVTLVYIDKEEFEEWSATVDADIILKIFLVPDLFRFFYRITALYVPNSYLLTVNVKPFSCFNTWWWRRQKCTRR